MRKHGGTPSRRDKHVTLAAISPPGVARGRFVGGQQSGLAGSKPPPLFTRGASSCSSQGRRQGEPWGASPGPSAPTYLPTSGLFLSLFVVRVLPPQIVFGVCVRSVPSNRKPFSQPQFPILFPSLNPVGKKTISIGQRRLRPLLELDTSAIEWLLEKSKSFP